MYVASWGRRGSPRTCAGAADVQVHRCGYTRRRRIFISLLICHRTTQMTDGVVFHSPCLDFWCPGVPVVLRCLARLDMKVYVCILVCSGKHHTTTVKAAPIEGAVPGESSRVCKRGGCLRPTREDCRRLPLFSPLSQISFPRPGALGLNLRSYFAELQAGARPGLPPYGCLELLEAQSVYLRVRRWSTR